ncbi:MAG: permease [Planctomycetota bacterium]
MKLGLSLLALLLGPLLHRLASRAGNLLEILDGFMLIAIGGLIFLDVLPQSVELAGWWALPVAIAGLFVPTLLERVRHRAGRHAHTAALALGVVGILVHGFVDGVALTGPSAPDGGSVGSLPIAVILHRVPIGLTIWWLLHPAFGRAIAAGALGALALSTVVGFHFGESLARGVNDRGLGLFAALVGGSLLHVVLHRQAPRLTDPAAPAGAPRHARLRSGIGAIGAIFFLAALLRESHEAHPAGPGAPQEHATGFGELLASLALESAPALLLAYITAGLVHAFLPQWTISWLGRGRHLTQSLRGLAFALPLPICSCGVIPIYRSLVLQGVPLAAAMTLLVAAPELGFDAVFLSLRLLDGGFTVARVLGAALLALFVGAIIGRLSGALARDHPPAAPRTKSAGGVGIRLREGFEVAFGELVDHTAPWIVVGLTIAAAAEPILDEAWIGRVPAALEVPLLALIGMPVYVCASGATPLVAVLVHNGVSPGAALAFLLTGPATNVTTFGVLKGLHGRRTALAFGISMALLSIGLGLAVNLTLPEVTTVLEEEEHSSSLLQRLCLGLIGLAFAASLLRQGPRSFVGQVLSSPDEGDSHHAPTGPEASGEREGCENCH